MIDLMKGMTCEDACFFLDKRIPWNMRREAAQKYIKKKKAEQKMSEDNKDLLKRIDTLEKNLSLVLHQKFNIEKEFTRLDTIVSKIVYYLDMRLKVTTPEFVSLSDKYASCRITIDELYNFAYQEYREWEKDD